VDARIITVTTREAKGIELQEEDYCSRTGREILLILHPETICANALQGMSQ
jgi:hypothetical protein